MKKLFCRNCGAELKKTFIDLGKMPLANSYLTAEQLSEPEPKYPLHIFVCSQCLLVQTESVVPPTTIFSDYAYFSSYSTSWLEHAQQFTKTIIDRFNLGPNSKVVELASNDGYLLKNFVAANIPCLGIEPAANVAKVALAAGIPTEIRFFDTEFAKDLKQQGWSADLIIANNVLAHVPDLNDFVSGIALLLKPEGVISIEVPHLLQLLKNTEFDTIYHEHHSYFSLYSLEKIFSARKLKIFDVKELSTHGGSLRIFVAHQNSSHAILTSHLEKIRAEERAMQMDNLTGYENFADQVLIIKKELLKFLNQAKVAGKQVVADGAAAKGNTLLNYCGITTDLIDYVVDRSPHKQGEYLPGSHLPIYPPEKIFTTKPDYVLILPWNLADEIMHEMQGIAAWGGQFVTAIPSLIVR